MKQISEQLYFNRPLAGEDPHPDVELYLAFKYALGRMSASVSSVSRSLIENWEKVRPEIRAEIHSMIEDAIENERAGMSCDVSCWQDVLALPLENQSIKP